MTFNVLSWKTYKKICHKTIFHGYERLKVMLINVFSPTFVPNLNIFNLKMGPGMPKSTGLLKDPSCAYLMKQIRHNRTRPCYVCK